MPPSASDLVSVTCLVSHVRYMPEAYFAGVMTSHWYSFNLKVLQVSSTDMPISSSHTTPIFCAEATPLASDAVFLLHKPPILNAYIVTTLMVVSL